MELSIYEKQILSVLGTDCGLITKYVANKFTSQFGRNKMEHSGDVRAWLLSLEKKGLVKRFDNDKPTAWVKVSNGKVSSRPHQQTKKGAVDLSESTVGLGCTWEDDEDGTWHTGCGGLYVINEGTPMLNDMAFCCYCGKPLEQIDFVYVDDA